MDTQRSRAALDAWLAQVEELLGTKDGAPEPDDEQVVEQGEAA